VADQQHTIAVIARHLTEAARPLIGGFRVEAEFKRLMARLGFSPTALPPAFQAASLDVEAALAALASLPKDPSPADLSGVLGATRKIFDAIASLAGAPPPPGVDPGAFKSEFATGLTGLLVNDYLARDHAAAFNFLATVGVIREQPVPAGAGRPAFVKLQFDWACLPRLVAQPSKLPELVYRWGTPDFAIRTVIDDIASFFAGLDFPVAIDRLDPADAVAVGIGPDDDEPPVAEVRLFDAIAGGKTLSAAFALHALPAAAGQLPGVMLEPRISADMPLSLELHPKVRMRLRPGTNAQGRLGIELRPNHVAVRNLSTPATPPPAAGIGIGFDFTPPAPVVLLGDPAGSRLEFASGSIDLAADFANGAWSIVLGSELKGFTFVFDPGEGDGFLRFLIGRDATAIGLPLGLQWSGSGIRFGGSGSFDVVVHPHLSIGPASIDEIDFRLGVPDEPTPKVRIEVGAGISGGIGPVSFALQGIGLRADVVFEPGNAGPFDIDIGFKPPTGVGISIDGGGFKGGGLLLFDSAKGEYAGALELTFAGFISVRAVGVLSTRLPDGGDTFSLVIIIVSEFVPIQLSWGFTLLGVGGLLGLNRTVEIDALQVGVRDGTLNSILFPADVVANAPRIISDLKRVFPPQEDRFLIGPMGKLGWGTPTLISVELGLLLEIPRPAFAILGVLRVQLPAEEFGLIYIQVNFVGSVDFEKGQLQFDASLYNSRVMISPLTGDMALRIYWGGDPNFLLTVGGFHPAYTPPPMNIGTLSRLGFVMVAGVPSVTAEIYLAVTSNSVQFGAGVEVMYGVKFFNVFGFVSLDVLIQFNPFRFIAEISAMFGVRVGSDVLFGIQVRGSIDGPAPWHVRGEASFEIGFIIKVRLSANFDVTVGDERKTLLQPIDVLAALRAALDEPGNWRAVLPPSSNQHVSLRELPDAGAALVVHPFGGLEIGQKIAPLNIAIQRIGSTRPDRGSLFRISAARINGADVSVTATTEQFAPGQFFDMSDAEKLSRPSFARYDAGIVIGAAHAPQADFCRMRDVRYEVIYLPEHHPVRLFFKMAATLFSAFSRGSAAGQSSLSRERRAPSAVAAEPAVFAAERYAVVSTLDMTLHAEPLVFESATAADQAVARLIEGQPALRGAIQVVPAIHMRSAA
jgi:hypothetical protein